MCASASYIWYSYDWSAKKKWNISQGNYQTKFQMRKGSSVQPLTNTFLEFKLLCF